MKLKNLTPHPVHIRSGDRFITVEPELESARCEEYNIGESNIDVDGATIKVVNGIRYGAVNLPPAVEGVIYIVSALVAQTSDRTDLMIPYDIHRDYEGNILGCNSLGVLA